MFGIMHLKRVVAACVLAAGAMLGLSSGGAKGQVLDTITCTGSLASNYNPPITNQPQTISFSAEASYGPCISTVPGISGGSRSTTSQINRSCASLLQGGTLTTTIEWNNGQTSTAQVNVTTNSVGAILTVTQIGTVTSGVFQGRSFVQQLTAPSIDIALCTLGLGTVSTIDYGIVLEIL